MKGLIGITNSKELFKKKEIELWELQSEMFEDKTIMRFQNLEDATNFGRDFVLDYLIPTYGNTEAQKFPMAKSGPAETLHTPEDGARRLGEVLGLSREDPTKEIWLVVPTDRYSEVQKYICSLDK